MGLSSVAKTQWARQIVGVEAGTWVVGWVVSHRTGTGGRRLEKPLLEHDPCAGLVSSEGEICFVT